MSNNIIVIDHPWRQDERMRRLCSPGRKRHIFHGVSGTTLDDKANSDLVHKRRKGERASKENSLNIDLYKVQRIPIDGNYTRRMNLLGYNPGTQKDR